MKTKLLLMVGCLCLAVWPVGCLQHTDSEISSDHMNGKSAEALIEALTRHVDNQTKYRYVSGSDVVFEDISDSYVLSDIPIEPENKFIRHTDDKCYVICSLQDNQLGYAFLHFYGDSGFGYYVDRCVQYPSEEIDSAFYDAILPIDDPETIV